jgi:hypothetical protein
MAAQKTKSGRSKLSAGILAYRKGAQGLEVLLVHPGGPFWRKKDNGAWSIPKGEIDAADDAEHTARREFAEELGPSASIVHCMDSGKSASEAESASLHSLARAISTPQCWQAIRSISNGHPEAAGDKIFQKSIEQSNLVSTPHDRKCFPRKGSS